MISGAGAKPPRQARSQATHDAIVRAALDVIREQGPDNFTLTDVVTRAQCTTGAIYSRFHDKEGLLLAVYEHLVDDWLTGIRAPTAPVSLTSLVRAHISQQIAIRRQDWVLRNAFLSRIIASAEFRAVSARMIQHSAAAIVAALANHPEIPSAEELRERAGLATIMIGATVERAITMRDAASEVLPHDDDSLADLLTAAVVAVLKNE